MCQLISVNDPLVIIGDWVVGLEVLKPPLFLSTHIIEGEFKVLGREIMSFYPIFVQTFMAILLSITAICWQIGNNTSKPPSHLSAHIIEGKLKCWNHGRNCTFLSHILVHLQLFIAISLR